LPTSPQAVDEGAGGAVPEELGMTGLPSEEEAGMIGLPLVDEAGRKIVALVWGLRTPVKDRPSLPVGLRLGKSVSVGAVRLAHCHEVLLAVSISDETPVFVRVIVILCVRVVEATSVIVSRSGL
jgi:hypothetical protein